MPDDTLNQQPKFNPQQFAGLSITISVTAEGAVNVSGPIDNLLIAYGLLEVGRDAIQGNAMRAAQQNQRVRPLTPDDAPILRKVLQ